MAEEMAYGKFIGICLYECENKETENLFIIELINPILIGGLSEDTSVVYYQYRTQSYEVPNQKGNSSSLKDSEASCVGFEDILALICFIA